MSSNEWSFVFKKYLKAQTHTFFIKYIFQIDNDKLPVFIGKIKTYRVVVDSATSSGSFIIPLRIPQLVREASSYRCGFCNLFGKLHYTVVDSATSSGSFLN